MSNNIEIRLLKLAFRKFFKPDYINFIKINIEIFYIRIRYWNYSIKSLISNEFNYSKMYCFFNNCLSKLIYYIKYVNLMKVKLKNY